MLMHVRVRVTLVGLAAALAMVCAVATASANRLSVSSETFRIGWSAIDIFGAGGFSFEVHCPLTMEGSFHSRTMAKTQGLLVGHVTRVTNPGESCVSGPVTVLTETLPWHVVYKSYLGSLPLIRSVRYAIVGFAIAMGITFEQRCLYGGSRAEVAGDFIIEHGTGIVGFLPDYTVQVARTSGLLCPEHIGLDTLGTVTELGEPVSIRLQLI